MDWENKFHSIVKETEENLAKAKEKLSSKASSSANNAHLGPPVSPPHNKTGSNYFSPHIATTTSTSYSRYLHQQASPVLEPSELNMMSAFSGLHCGLQEQISSQNKTIERLQKLVRSLDNERDYYKEQISHLKGEVDCLTDRMSSQFAIASSERQMSDVKREVMREIDSLKIMMQNFMRDSNKRPALSSYIDEDFWTLKESLSTSLEQVGDQLSLMNKRIDRMEMQIASESHDRHGQAHMNRSFHGTSYTHRLPPLYTPTYKSPEEVESFDVFQLRHTIGSLNTRLNTLEKKIEQPRTHQPPLYSPRRSSQPLSSFLSPRYRSSAAAVNGHDADDLSSLSDLSDLSDLGGDNLGGDIDGLTYALKDGVILPNRTKTKTSIYKADRVKKGKVEFDLSDLDLSDVDDVDLETDSLDLDN